MVAVLGGTAFVVPGSASARETSDAAPAPRSDQVNLLENPGFEKPAPGTNGGGWGWMLKESQVPGWSTNDPRNEIEMWYTSPSNMAGFAGGQTAFEGTYFVELDANAPSTLFQDMRTRPGDVITWRLAHRARGRNSSDTMQVLVGAGGGNGLNGLTPSVPTEKDGVTLSPPRDPNAAGGAHLTDTSAAWGVWSGTYTVPAGQTVTRFAFQAVSSSLGSGVGNFLDGISFRGTPPPPDPTCDTVPFRRSGGSATVGSTTVTVRNSSAKDAATLSSKWAGYYWHDSLLPGRETTTWEFEPGIDEIEIDIRAHDDGRPPEQYDFVGRDADGKRVLDWTLIDTNGAYVWRFARPLTTLRADFLPVDGNYGSLVRLRLSSGDDGCGAPEEAPKATPVTVVAPVVRTTFGETADIPAPTAYVTGTEPPVAVAFVDEPVCTVRDADETELTPDEDTPAGRYEIQCTGGTVAKGFEIEVYGSGSYVVTALEPELEYTAETTVHAGQTFTPLAELRPRRCRGPLRFTITPDPTGSDDRLVVDDPVSTTGWATGDYEVRVRYAGSEGCTAVSTTQSLTVTTAPDTARPPDEPLGVRVVAVDPDGSVRLRWDEPADDGGAPVLRYTVFVRRVTEESYQEYSRPTERRERISGLTPGKRYWFRVRAVNRMGAGPTGRTPERILVPR